METADEDVSRKSKRHAKKCADIGRILVKEEIKARVKQVSEILKKTENARTEADNAILQQSPEIVKSIGKRRKSRDAAKQRQLEVEDETDVLKSKSQQLAQALQECRNVVVYTGAGISTHYDTPSCLEEFYMYDPSYEGVLFVGEYARYSPKIGGLPQTLRFPPPAASIPDYRGPNGVWTLLQQGKQVEAQDLSDAEPTLTHMAIAKLQHENIVKHVVSQNCDGLHLRSGLSRNVLSEVHGNMFIELCKECEPQREYVRLFDVTERTGVRRHGTGRDCHMCGSPLKDTIVHFGEKGGLESPYNWQEAADAVDDCDMILCLGSSLKILRKYPCLWCMDMRPKDRPKLFIVNLQWTPKDDFATLKINGKCDEVMGYLMEELNMEIPEYRRAADPIFKLFTPLQKTELTSTSKKVLQTPLYIEPNQFSLAAKSLARQRKTAKKKVAASEVYKTIKSLLDKDVEPRDGCENDNVLVVDGEATDRGSADSDLSKVKREHPLLTSKLGLSPAKGQAQELQKAQSEICKQCSGSNTSCAVHSRLCSKQLVIIKDEECSNVPGVTSKSSINQVVASKTVKSDSSSSSGGLSADDTLVTKDVTKPSGQTSEVQVNDDSKPSTSPVTSIPGWFGKGCNPRKRKRKI